MLSAFYAQDLRLQPGIPRGHTDRSRHLQNRTVTAWVGVELVWRPVAKDS